MARVRSRPISTGIAELLRARMQDLGVTQTVLAERAGVSQMTVSRHMRGQGMPVDTLDLYCRALGLDISEVIAQAAQR